MAISDVDFEYVRQLVRQHSGIMIDSDKSYLAESRLGRLAEREGFTTPGELLAKVRNGQPPVLRQKVVEAMTIAETLFFRDVNPFDCLKNDVLPQLIQKRASEKRLSIWSAACATGQEPYSLAMLLRESFPVLRDWTVDLVASDLSNESLERARQGSYNLAEINRGLPAGMLVEYFTQEGQFWQVKEELRRMIRFEKINLTDPWPYLPNMDIIMLRNVMIYFEVETKKAILGKVRWLLKPDGYLFLGTSETTLNLDDAFDRTPHEHAGCFRLNGVR